MNSTRLLTARTSKLVSNVRAIKVRRMGDHPPAHWKSARQVAIDTCATMDHLPKANIPWQQHYGKMNNKWNIQLAASTLFFCFTMFAMQKSGVFLFFGPPAMKNK